VSESRRHTSSALTPDDARRLDALCDRFEATWRSGKKPKLDEYLAQAAGTDASVVLAELLPLELAYRRLAGETPRPDEYRRRFPDHAHTVDAAFAESQALGQAISQASRAPEALVPAATMHDPDAPRGLSRDEFARIALASGLLTREKLAQRLREHADDAGRVDGSAKALARFLVGCGDLTRYQAERLLAGRSAGFLLGDYKILDKLGAGGMGKVYVAEQTKLRRQVALKVLPRDRAGDQRYVERFQREARAAAALKHPNIVQVYDVGNHGPTHFIVMELVRGKNLKELLRERGALAPADAARLVEQVAQGLAHAHERGIVHRDIKPSNLVLEGATVKVLDLGLARQFEEGEALTGDGKGLGTADYMSPEQCRDAHSADQRSDLYSLGCTWYELVAGRPPFDSGDSISKALAHMQQEPPPVRRLAPAVPDALAAMIHKLLRKAPEDRYQTCGELLADLARWRASGESPAADSFAPSRTDAAAITVASPSAAADSSSSLSPADDSSSDTLIRRPTTVPMYFVYLLPVMGALVLGGAYFGIEALRKQMAENLPEYIEIPSHPPLAPNNGAVGGTTTLPAVTPLARREDQGPLQSDSNDEAVERPSDAASKPDSAIQNNPPEMTKPEPADKQPATTTHAPGSEVAPEPALASEQRPPRVWRVGTHDQDQPDLEAACNAAADGDIIVLGQKPLRAGNLDSNGKHITLRPADNLKVRPIVVFDWVATAPASRVFWRLVSGGLTVKGIDFYVDVSGRDAPADEIVFFELVESDLRLNDSTMTVVRGSAEGRTPVTAIKLSGERAWDPNAKGDPPRALEVDLRDALLRGTTTAVYVESRQAVVRAENVIICGPGPLFHVFHIRPLEFDQHNLLIELGSSILDVDGPLVEIECRPFSLVPVNLAVIVRSSLMTSSITDAHPPQVLWRSPIDDDDKRLSKAIRWTGSNNGYVRRGDGLRAKLASGPLVTFVASPADWQRLGLGVETGSTEPSNTPVPAGRWHERKPKAYEDQRDRSRKRAKTPRAAGAIGADLNRVPEPRPLPRR
jgi:eukaryotic-like serine/threonine-protein kinase